MRRAEREITDLTEVLRVIQGCLVCRLGMLDGDQPYVVPLSFGYVHQNGTLVLYFHGARAGKKRAVLQQNPTVCFEMDRQVQLLSGGDVACHFSMAYESVIGFGTFAEVDDNSPEKEVALRRIMSHYAPARSFSFDANALASVLVFKVLSTSFSGKQRPLF